MLMVSGKTSVIKLNSGQGAKGTHPPLQASSLRRASPLSVLLKDSTSDAVSFVLYIKGRGLERGKRVNCKNQGSSHPDNSSSFGYLGPQLAGKTSTQNTVVLG